MKSRKLFQIFLTNHDPGQVVRHLREVLLGFISYCHEAGLPTDFQTYLQEFDDLFYILDRSEDELKIRP